MKSALVLALSIVSLTSFAKITPKRVALFECAHLKEGTPVDRLFIYESTLGRRTFYEAEVKLLQMGIESSYFTTLNLVSKYNGKILHYTNGNFRVKIDKVQVNEQKYSAFARIPEYEIHSFDWTCKDAL